MTAVNPFERMRSFLGVLSLAAVAGLGFGVSEANAATTRFDCEPEPPWGYCSWPGGTCSTCCVTYDCPGEKCTAGTGDWCIKCEAAC
jgi:hypothetical protein